MPRAKVVLPAPSSPRRKITSPGSSECASAAPNARVAASSGRSVFRATIAHMEGMDDSIEARIKRWGRELGFDELAIAGIDLAADEAKLLEWLDRGWHGEMDYMARHGAKRARPAELVPGTASVITARLNYQPAQARDT